MHEILRLFPQIIKDRLEKQIANRWDELQEIRLRLSRPVELNFNRDTEWVRSAELNREDCQYVMNQLSEFSLYRIEDELRQGYITIRGGHRVGLAGTAITRSGSIHALRDISFFNIRVAKEKKGAASGLMPYLAKQDYCHTLLVGPPKTGKTTIIRDLARTISEGWRHIPPKKVAVIDERSEIAATFNGLPQHDIGKRTDVLNACPKAEGMIMMIRSMSPDILIADEMGSQQDVQAILDAAHAGMKVITSIHASSIDDLKKRPSLDPLWERQFFERIVFLKAYPSPGSIRQVISGSGAILFQEAGMHA